MPASDVPPPQRYRTCDVCGESFDTQDLDQVFYHGPEAHLPSVANDVEDK